MANFYSKDSNNQLLSTSQVFFQDGSFIVLDNHSEYTYPVQGWYYFETDEDASAFFGIRIE